MVIIWLSENLMTTYEMLILPIWLISLILCIVPSILFKDPRGMGLIIRTIIRKIREDSSDDFMGEKKTEFSSDYTAEEIEYLKRCRDKRQ